MDIVSYSDCRGLDAIEAAWGNLSQRELRFIPAFSHLRRHVQGHNAKFRILVAISGSEIRSIACFIYLNKSKRYEIATRTLLRLPVRELVLVGSCILGEPSEEVIRKFFQIVISESDFDIINLGDIFIDSPLYRAVTSLRGGVMAWSGGRKKRVWWLVKLPTSFAEYSASLSKGITNDCKKCAKAGANLRVMQRPEEVEAFLRDAEKISRSTYQWKLGSDYSVRNDDATRQRFTLLAENGTLRCYLIYLHDKPCAFGWGELSHRSFVFEQTGYDPQYRSVSPGTTLVMQMIRDLIENTDCEVFDFKWGGEDGYKSRYANVSLSFVSMKVAKFYKPYSFLIIALDQTIGVVRTMAGLVVERGTSNQFLRAILRRCGIGTF